ncbi:thiol-disulfide oxidoreductase DCC family protein [Streptomyces sp. NPDC056796]|uniref:thiol-disulfide oxidoreductase DCC family protein n=1 Tax=unclassified Streptomyces TaxID=2593676 RepID=UPI0036BC2338
MRMRPVLVYDGDCAFCTSSVMFVERHVRPHCEAVPWQFADLGSLGVTQERAEYELLWITPTGVVHGGAQAVAKLLLNAGKGWAVLGAILTLPPARWIARRVYRLVADNRQRMPGGTPACALPADRRPGGRTSSPHIPR